MIDALLVIAVVAILLTCAYMVWAMTEVVKLNRKIYHDFVVDDMENQFDGEEMT